MALSMSTGSARSRLAQRRRPTPETVQAVASSYEVEVDDLYPARVPVEVRDGAVAVGDTSVRFHSPHLDDVLVAFLELIRTLRGTSECPVVSFRRIDIEALADYLNVEGSEVVAQLAVMVGAKRLRSAAMGACIRDWRRRNLQWSH